MTKPKTIETVAREVIGLSYRQAEAAIKEAGFECRAVMIDGAGIPGITNMSTTRLKLFLVNDAVTEARVGLS